MLLGIISDRFSVGYERNEYKIINYSDDIEDLKTFDSLIIDFNHIRKNIGNSVISMQFTQNLIDFAKLGRNVLIIMPNADLVLRYRNVHGTTSSESIGKYLEMIYPEIKISSKKYTKFENRQSVKFEDIKLDQSLFTFKNIEPFVCARNTNDIIMGYNDGSKVMFSPFIPVYPIALEVFEFFNKSNMIEIVPDWINEYNILNESEIKATIAVLTSEIIKLKEQKESNIQNTNYLAKIKSILFTSGDYLHDIVNEILIDEFGFERIKNTKINEDDTIIKHDNRYLVIEVKGVKNSISSKNVMQALKWTTDFKLRLIDSEPDIDDRVKACLIGNPMKAIEINERVDEFPLDTIKTANSNNVGMINTKCLLDLFVMFKKGAIDKSKIFEVLYTNKGLITVEKFA